MAQAVNKKGISLIAYCLGCTDGNTMRKMQEYLCVEESLGACCGCCDKVIPRGIRYWECAYDMKIPPNHLLNRICATCWFSKDENIKAICKTKILIKIKNNDDDKKEERNDDNNDISKILEENEKLRKENKRLKDANDWQASCLENQRVDIHVLKTKLKQKEALQSYQSNNKSKSKSNSTTAITKGGDDGTECRQM